MRPRPKSTRTHQPGPTPSRPLTSSAAAKPDQWRWLRQKKLEAEDGEEHESDVIYITRGFRLASLDASSPTADAPSPTADADAAPSFLSTAKVFTMAGTYEKVRRGLETDWHEQTWRGSTNDPNRLEHLSTEFG